MRAYEKGKEVNTQPTMTEEAKRIMFGQTAASIAAGIAASAKE